MRQASTWSSSHQLSLERCSRSCQMFAVRDHVEVFLCASLQLRSEPLSTAIWPRVDAGNDAVPSMVPMANDLDRCDRTSIFVEYVSVASPGVDEKRDAVLRCLSTLEANARVGPRRAQKMREVCLVEFGFAFSWIDFHLLEATAYKHAPISKDNLGESRHWFAGSGRTRIERVGYVSEDV